MDNEIKETDMNNLPKDPVMLLSVVNTNLRDFYSNLDEFCKAKDADKQEIIEKLKMIEYTYDEEKNEYYMEYADETLKKFIERNNSTLTINRRRGIAMQIFKGFSYIHSKGYLHRDISFTNVLLQHYENDLTIVKISDFGLVKMKQSDLTSFGSEIKGSLNDSNLQIVGFGNYNMEYETFALTRLIYYVMTGRYNLENIKNQKVKDFVLKGISSNLDERYHSVAEMQQAFEVAFPMKNWDFIQ